MDTVSLNVRNIDPELRRSFKVACDMKDTNMSAVIVEFMRKTVAKAEARKAAK